jgi:pilus assembly protein Flp/PilA
MTKLINAAKNFLNDDSGATMVEYALMVALVAAVCVTAVTALGTAISSKFTSSAGSI